MRIFSGSVIEIGWSSGLGRSAWIECREGQPPDPGRYLLGWSPEAADAPLAAPLYACTYGEGSFQAAGSLPEEWEPGTQLILRGPLGRGFSRPTGIKHMALAAVQSGAARLLPLLDQALQNGCAVALFIDSTHPDLPAAVEINPLAALPEALIWADYLAMDLPLTALPGLSACLGYAHPPSMLPFPAQALVDAPMPCGSVADCGACAVETRHGWKLVCSDGPVFDLVELLPRGS